MSKVEIEEAQALFLVQGSKPRRVQETGAREIDIYYYIFCCFYARCVFSRKLCAVLKIPYHRQYDDVCLYVHISMHNTAHEMITKYTEGGKVNQYTQTRKGQFKEAASMSRVSKTES